MRKKLTLLTVGTMLLGMQAHAHNVDFDKILYWTGEGENEAALIIQFNDETRGTNSYVYGYRWPAGETRTGKDMFMEICQNNESLYLLTQFTGGYGNTVCGIGMSLDNGNFLDALYFDFDHAQTVGGNAFDFYNAGGNTLLGQTSAPGDDTPELMQNAIWEAFESDHYHVIMHPLSADIYGYPSYDYDSWFLNPDYCVGDESWQSGWYNGYWSYWVADGDFDLSYSGLGYSSRQLKNGSVDGWSFSDFAEVGAGIVPGEEADLVYEGHDAATPKRHISITGIDDDATEIVINPKRIVGLMTSLAPVRELVTADKVELTDYTREDGKIIASAYKVNYWDKNGNRVQFYELSGHYPGTAHLKITYEGYTREFDVKVEEPDRETLVDYTTGTIILNEEWFGHTNGGLNYVTEDGEMIYQAYERENPFMSFGATSQYGTIWAGKLIVASKQAVDGGDPMPGGGRLVVADAATLKRIGSIDDLKFGDETSSADGRAIAGATPSKIYVGSTNGIYVVDLDNVAITGKVTGLTDEGASTYSGQIGDMLNAGRYVFGIRQQTGVFVIDTETDAVVTTIESPAIQGITQSADGNIWYVETVSGQSNFVCIDPVTFEEIDRVVLPSANKTIACGWGAWRSTQFYGAKKSNDLWFLSGAGAFSGGGTNFYRYHIGDEMPEDGLKPVFTLEGRTGSNADVKQKAYGTLRYDDRTGQLIAMSIDDSASGHYRYSWTYFVNGETGEIEREIALEPYYWFQSLPIFPDKEKPVLNLGNITLTLGGEPYTADLKELATDADNIDANIMFELVTTEDNAEGQIAEVALDGTTLTVTPQTKGTQYVNIAMSSNGKVTNKSIQVTVSETSSVEEIGDRDKTISCDGTRLYINGCNGTAFSVYSTNGTCVFTFNADSDSFIAQLPISSGVYVVAGDNGMAAKIVIE